MTAALLDLGTMGKAPVGALVQIGAVLIIDRDPSDETAFFANISLRSSIEAGLRVDPETAAWWWEQPPAARNRLFDPAPASLRSVLEHFSAWVRTWSVTEIWSNKELDVANLEAAYRGTGLALPYDHRSTRDLRTLYSHFPEQLVTDLLSRHPEGHVDHVSLHDARRHARVAAELLAVLQTALGGLFESPAESTGR